jgi:hypothetical protein
MSITITSIEAPSPTTRKIGIHITSSQTVEVGLALQELIKSIDAKFVDGRFDLLPLKVEHTRNNIQVVATLVDKIYQAAIWIDGKPLTEDLQGRIAASYTYVPKYTKSKKTKIQ